MDSINPDPAHIPDDDLQLQGYQDDLDTSGTITDPITHELTDDPVETFGVPAEELATELNHYDFESRGNSEDGEDDRREDIESRDMDTDEDASN